MERDGFEIAIGGGDNSGVACESDSKVANGAGPDILRHLSRTGAETKDTTTSKVIFSVSVWDESDKSLSKSSTHNDKGVMKLLTS